MTTTINTFTQLDTIVADVQRHATNADYRLVLEQSQQSFAAEEAAAFAAQSAPGGDAWAALAPSTAKRKGTSRILFETGALLASLVNVGGTGNIHEVDQDGLTFGTDVGYAMFHQDGTTTIPQRAFVGISEATIQAVIDKIADTAISATERM